MFTVNPTEPRQTRARSKARSMCPNVEATSYGHYLVEGSGGDFYGVKVTAAAGAVEIGCNCMAGQNDKPCYHAFAALRLHETLAVPANPVGAPRDKRLKYIEGDLRTIERAAGEMTGNFEQVDVIFRAVRAALQSLGEYEIDLLPEVVGCDMAA